MLMRTRTPTESAIDQAKALARDLKGHPLELDAWRLAAAIARLRPVDEAERVDGERLERVRPA